MIILYNDSLKIVAIKCISITAIFYVKNILIIPVAFAFAEAAFFVACL